MCWHPAEKSLPKYEGGGWGWGLRPFDVLSGVSNTSVDGREGSHLKRFEGLAANERAHIRAAVRRKASIVELVGVRRR